MTTETMTVQLKAGGEISIIIDADFLNMDIDDFRFVSRLAQLYRNYGGMPIVIEQPVLPTEGANEVSFPVQPPPTPPKTRTKTKAKTKVGEPAKRRGRPPKPKSTNAQVTQISSAKSARSAAPVRKVRQPGHDYQAIARSIIDIRSAGDPVAPRLMEIYKVPMSTAKNWMTRCRDLGLIPPLVAGLKVIEDNTIDSNNSATYNAAGVADAYLGALRDNRRPIAAVADSFGIDKGTATSWVRQARLDGALPSAAEPQLPEAERRKLLDMSKPESAS